MAQVPLYRGASICPIHSVNPYQGGPVLDRAKWEDDVRAVRRLNDSDQTLLRLAGSASDKHRIETYLHKYILSLSIYSIDTHTQWPDGPTCSF